MPQESISELNMKRLSALEALAVELRRELELHAVWQASQSGTDFKAYVLQRTKTELADREHQRARQAMVDTGYLPTNLAADREERVGGKDGRTAPAVDKKFS